MIDGLLLAAIGVMALAFIGLVGIMFGMAWTVGRGAR